MTGKLTIKQDGARGIILFVLMAAVVTFAFLGATAGIAAVTSLSVLGVNKTVPPAPPPAPAPLAGGYRWVLEEDVTFRIEPGLQTADILAVDFHKSYMPVVAQGDDINALADIILDPDKYYYVSVIPKEPGTYSIGGAGFKGSDTTVTVYLNQLPLPTAQITVFVHEDLNPINNVWDEGEAGLPGFRIILEDAGGRYGMSAGEQSQDAFGNPLGTAYLRNCDPYGQPTVPPGEGTYGCLEADGSPVVDPDNSGLLLTGPDGSLTIKNLAPGKYGIIVVPPNAVQNPPGSGNWVSDDWVQTSTIEGTVLIDAWVKANEPPFFAEFGPAGPHTSFGFVPAGPNTPYSALTGGGITISGQIVNQHLSRPPQTAFHSGAPFPHTTAWVGLNEGVAGQGRGVYAARANEDGTFSIPNVAPGNYQLVVWDDNLDLIFAFHDLAVGTSNIALGEVPVFQWFTRLENWVFYDQNENGFRDAGEPGIAEQAVNLRWRDGSMYQSMPTDGEGFVPFDEVFPFFSWLVAEVDFARFKATGMTVTVDDGGPIDPADPWTWDGHLNPQDQVGGPTLNSSLTTTTRKYRTERGPVLTQGFQGFLGQTSVIQWGKKDYGPGENGGISGMVFYAVTRAEDDPELGFPEPWEPGIPRVTVNLYDATGTTLLNTTTTDSWDDSLPTGCPPGSNAGSPDDDPYVFRGKALDCYDGMRNWNQVRPAVFDGGYAFDAIIDPATQQEISPIPAGNYVVEVIPPPGYEIVRSQDKNVDFGDTYIPSPQLLPPQCVGDLYTVPAELTLFPGVPANLDGEELNTCDRKLVVLGDGANAAADFFLFTQTPIAGHIKGFILDDTANEFDPASPQFGEKFAPPWLPVAIRDWTGRMIGSTYSDEYGTYNVLIPSSYTNSLPQPSGMSPNMLTACMNDPEADTVGGFFNPQYSTFCYTFQYMPGTTTYLDTPVVPVAAFAGPDQFPLDCEFPDGSPRILSVVTSEEQGPYLAGDVNGTITITALGTAVQVPNPAYDGVGGTQPRTIPRDFGFGDVEGTVYIGDVQLTDVNWGNTVITATVPAGTPTGQLVVTRDNGRSSVTAVTLQVGDAGTLRTVLPGGSIQAAIDLADPNDLILVAPGTYSEMVIMWKPVRLQGSGEGTLINAVKSPPEKVVAWRELLDARLTAGDFDFVPGQDNGFIPGVLAEPFSSEEGTGVLVVAKADSTDPGSFTLNPGARIDGFTIRGADTGGGIVVNGYADYLEISNNRIINNNGFYNGGIRVGHPFLTTDNGEGDFIHTDSENDFITISRNQITQNGGFDGAGGGVSLYTGSDDYQVTGNFVCGNFTLGNGAGVAHLGMSDNGLIQDNTILFNENFNQLFTVNGGGISISGHAPFGCPVDPVTGEPDPACLTNPIEALSPGSGSVTISRNRIQGNSSGSGDGAGIRLNRINGQDIVEVVGEDVQPVDPGQWYSIDVINNMIVNNVASLAGGGISIQDALRVNIWHNTIAHNDSAATAGEAFTPGSSSQSNPQPGAGIASRVHTSELSSFLQLLPAEAQFSDPDLVNNIIWQNRQFYFMVNDTDPTNVLYGLCPDINDDIGLGCTNGTAPVFSDLAVLPAGSGTLNPLNSLLTDTSGYDGSNITGDPLFYAEYFNGNRESTITIPETTTSITPTVAFDEGGNFIRLRFGPLTETMLDPDTMLATGEPYGDYHIYAGSDAVDAGIDLGVTDDFDGPGTRTDGSPDIGADENDGTVPPAAPAVIPGAIIQSASPSSWTPDQQLAAEQPGTAGSTTPASREFTSVEPLASSPITTDGGPETLAGSVVPADQAQAPSLSNSGARSGGGYSPDDDDSFVTGTDAVQPMDTPPTVSSLYGLQPAATQLPGGEELIELQENMPGRTGTGSRPEASGRIGTEETLAMTAAAPEAGNADQSGTEGTADRERRTLVSAMPFASLIVLVLGGLFFFVVLQPKLRKKTTQRKRGDI
ncbi:MAG: hypothetical protein SCH71_13625 [Desulfobulbaceae bacterium]|nr:hypothetical protein [Desulfobulbaceae bacterium]